MVIGRIGVGYHQKRVSDYNNNKNEAMLLQYLTNRTKFKFIDFYRKKSIGYFLQKWLFPFIQTLHLRFTWCYQAFKVI